MCRRNVSDLLVFLLVVAVAVALAVLQQPQPDRLLPYVVLVPLALGAGLVGLALVSVATRYLVVRASVWLVKKYRRRTEAKYQAFVLRHFLGSVLAGLRSEFDRVYWQYLPLEGGFMLVYLGGCWTVAVQEYDGNPDKVMLALYSPASTEPVYQTGYEGAETHAPTDLQLLELTAMTCERLPLLR